MGDEGEGKVDSLWPNIPCDDVALGRAALPFQLQPQEPPCLFIFGAEVLSMVYKPDFPLISELVEKVGSVRLVLC